MEDTTKPETVAVIGLGALGLVATKNLLEEGFEVTAFERNNYVGGLWHYTDEDKTSVLPTTVINISKERGTFTDFPFAADTPSHCSASDVQNYLENYADHFGLAPHFRLGAVVTHVSYENDNSRWRLDIEGSKPLFFDKVVLATGINHIPNIPKLRGGEVFAGQCLHSRAFKRPEAFKGKKVLIVGLGNTGADTAAALQGHAEDVYIAHSHGAYVMPRTLQGRPLDHTLTSRLVAIQGLVNHYFPSLGEWLFDKMVAKVQNNSFNIRPEWKFFPAPSVKHNTPIISDNLVPLLESGGIKSVSGLKQAVGPNEIELEDGTRLEIDTVIWCTGYKADFSLLDRAVDPTRHTTPQWSALAGSRGKPLPRLYQNVLSLDHPTSLAIMGAVAIPSGAYGKAAQPSRLKRRWNAWICDIASKGSAIPSWVRAHEWLAWANEAAGTGVDEHLGWGWAGWKFWLSDREFCNLLQGGIYSPHISRVFDGKRKKWGGARAEIERVNKAVAERKQKGD
ncbi:FAD/NAD(P)-binding domain-containing protein [Thozetella sp. PMI_491]|nr:FAD/NAD(P)-binding domain-containing protein [Thozetella sp. PMI_491]